MKESNVPGTACDVRERECVCLRWPTCAKESKVELPFGFQIKQRNERQRGHGSLIDHHHRFDRHSLRDRHAADDSADLTLPRLSMKMIPFLWIVCSNTLRKCFLTSVESFAQVMKTSHIVIRMLTFTSNCKIRFAALGWYEQARESL